LDDPEYEWLVRSDTGYAYIETPPLMGTRVKFRYRSVDREYMWNNVTLNWYLLCIYREGPARQRKGFLKQYATKRISGRFVLQHWEVQRRIFRYRDRRTLQQEGRYKLIEGTSRLPH